MQNHTKLLSVVILCSSLTGCADLQSQLDAINSSVANNQPTIANNPGAIATITTVANSQPTQLIAPSDKRTREAMDAALPAARKILAIHQCVKMDAGMLQLNYLAVPGVGFGNPGPFEGSGAVYYPNSKWGIKYHDFNKCMNIRVIDNWTMPALNALQFRAVYFAEDSGETVSFNYLMKKTDDGAWKLESLRRIL